MTPHRVLSSYELRQFANLNLALGLIWGLLLGIPVWLVLLPMCIKYLR